MKSSQRVLSTKQALASPCLRLPLLRGQRSTQLRAGQRKLITSACLHSMIAEHPVPPQAGAEIKSGKLRVGEVLCSSLTFESAHSESLGVSFPKKTAYLGVASTEFVVMTPSGATTRKNCGLAATTQASLPRSCESVTTGQLGSDQRVQNDGCPFD